jgi:hypothetical protein
MKPLGQGESFGLNTVAEFICCNNNKASSKIKNIYIYVYINHVAYFCCSHWHTSVLQYALWVHSFITSNRGFISEQRTWRGLEVVSHSLMRNSPPALA